MHTNLVSQPVALFLFAHQDDEFGVFQQLLVEGAAQRLVLCAYLTDGVTGNVTASQRNTESLGVLKSLGVDQENVMFVGEHLGIGDAYLPKNINKVDSWLRNFLDKNSVEKIYVPAWEGGHHDHDALHAVAVKCAHDMGCSDKVLQYSLYNAFNCPGPFFSVLKPLSENGSVIASRITLRNRIKFFYHCFAYPSQRITWLGLLPFVFLHYLTRGCQELQSVNVERIKERPHAGDLYYEKRKFFTWEEMNDLVNK
ncbi:GlcNAc-PI de-N-acetylase [Janthinobacterium sp. OK676]|uniref:PIG-L deacetylase family protein n=1 Tax=Janthinobacterium sp. OK676 TaxID=1855295 RepID=UPI00087EBB42|nr:PIG-L family deacetylase [Janthinobacterium sp. OK676]SDM81501.1 GlcNAc-PI de-N-acetylase [Janthinobacterium sp. OK676]